MDSTPFERLTARLATMDLDPETIEILTAVLTVDLDVRSNDADGDPRREVVPVTT